MFVLSRLTTIGYGDIPATTTGEAVWMILGKKKKKKKKKKKHELVLFFSDVVWFFCLRLGNR